MTTTTAYLDIYAGDKSRYEVELARYQACASLVSKHAEVFGLPPVPEELNEEQREILLDLHKSQDPLRFDAPTPLLLGRVVFDLDQSPGLSKTRQNFLSLCTGEKGFSKNAPTKKLHYLDCPIHRLVNGFVAQGGDVTRGDGSGGESIYGPKFACEKAGLQIAPSRGSLAMANSGGKSPTSSSQFFIVLAKDEKALAKLKGKYVVFGQVREGQEVLDKLDQIAGDKDEKPTMPIWIGACGIL